MGMVTGECWCLIWDDMAGPNNVIGRTLGQPWQVPHHLPPTARELSERAAFHHPTILSDYTHPRVQIALYLICNLLRLIESLLLIMFFYTQIRDIV